MFFVDHKQREYISKPIKHSIIAKRASSICSIIKQYLVVFDIYSYLYIMIMSMCDENIINLSASYIEYVLNCCKSEL